MKQFDVYINPSPSTRVALPFIVDIQSPVISELATRIVIPLGRMAYFKNDQLKGLTPVIEYQDERLLLLTPQIASVPTKKLKNPVGSLADCRDDIISALDFAITGF